MEYEPHLSRHQPALLGLRRGAARSYEAGVAHGLPGRTYLDPEGELRAGVVFDNLIHRGEMPLTIGVFVDPGRARELLPATSKRPLRVFLQANTHDINWDRGEPNWFSANLRVAAALAERGYDLRLVVRDGAHDTNHCGVILPDALRWLRRR